MRKETRHYIITLMEHRFQVQLQKNTTTYIPEEVPSYFLYELQDRSFYRGHTPCLSTSLTSMEQMKETLQLTYNFEKMQEESYFYCDHMLPLKTIHNLSINVLEQHHKAHLHDLKAQCNHIEIETAAVDMDDYMVFGAYYHNILVSAASVIYRDEAYDIGILTMPAYRGMHISTALVRYCNNWIIEQGGISQYRCQNDNLASYHTALQAGFEKGIDVCIATKKGALV